MEDCWVDIQVSVIFKITHSSVLPHIIRLQRGVNLWLLIKLLLTESPSNIPPPIFARNYHQAQPTGMSVGTVSDLREVSITDCWDSHYQPTDKILPNITLPDFVHNYHQAQHKVLSVGIGSDVTKVSMADCWDSYYKPNTPSIFHPLFSRGIIIRHNPQFCPLE